MTSEGAFLYSMMRTACIFHDDANVKRDIFILVVMLLFSEYVTFDENETGSPHHLSLPAFFHQKLLMPSESGTSGTMSSHQVKYKVKMSVFLTYR